MQLKCIPIIPVIGYPLHTICSRKGALAPAFNFPPFSRALFVFVSFFVLHVYLSDWSHGPWTVGDEGMPAYLRLFFHRQHTNIIVHCPCLGLTWWIYITDRKKYFELVPMTSCSVARPWTTPDNLNLIVMSKGILATWEWWSVVYLLYKFWYYLLSFLC